MTATSRRSHGPGECRLQTSCSRSGLNAEGQLRPKPDVEVLGVPLSAAPRNRPFHAGRRRGWPVTAPAPSEQALPTLSGHRGLNIGGTKADDALDCLAREPREVKAPQNQTVARLSGPWFQIGGRVG